MTFHSLRRHWRKALFRAAGALLLSAGGLLGSAAAFDDSPKEDMPRILPEAIAPTKAEESRFEASKVEESKAASIPGKPGDKEDLDPLLWDEAVKPVSCSSCGGGGCSSCGHRSFGRGPGQCIPGREDGCDCHFGHGFCGRCIGGLYECLCCPDPCYEPCWLPAADSAFWLDAARPKSQMRIYWTTVWDFSNPDAAEWFWAQIGGKGPKRNGAGLVGTVDYKDLRMYNEAAGERFSAFVDWGWRRTDPEFFPGQGNFSDVIVGTKSLLLDCELLQFTFQFKTYIPAGNAAKGLGTGHVSLEPSFLCNLRLSEDAYLQSQLAYWIPVGGTGGHQGSVFHYHFSVNKVLWKPCCDLQFVAVGEFGGYVIGDGEYTISANPEVRGRTADLGSIFYVAPGFRLFVCEKYDIGASYNMAVTDDNFGDKALKLEFRMRF